MGDTTKTIAAALTVIATMMAPTVARAVPGPDSVVVVANANVPQSVALAERYAAERDLPPGQLCALDLPATIDIALADFQTRALDALDACLDSAGALERIEAVLLVRGVPLRVTIPLGGSDRRVSFAAALGTWRSTTGDGQPVLGQAPGMTADCGGSPCYAARWPNPFQAGPFEPGFTRAVPGIDWHPLLVTMLHGYSYEDAEGLLDSALEAEAMGGPDGELLFMQGADPARSALDPEFPTMGEALRMRGFTDVATVSFDANLTGHTLAAFFVGTANLGTTIEGNTFRPGALVDNLTSFGAVPENFDPMAAERQVSISRWVAMGVAGAHGTTDEPLSNVFPSRRLVVDYVDGSTLAEAYHRRLPSVYWQNLVLGDPMLAPYAVRPEVIFEGVGDGDTVADARRVTVSATDAEGFGVSSLVVLLDDVEIGRVEGDHLELCLDVPAGTNAQLLAVAQKTDDGTSNRALYRPKGWLAIDVTGAAGASVCPDADAGAGATDAGATDGGAATDGGGITTPRADDGGCGCRLVAMTAMTATTTTTATTARRSAGWLFAFVLLARLRRRG